MSCSQSSTESGRGKRFSSFGIGSPAVASSNLVGSAVLCGTAPLWLHAPTPLFLALMLPLMLLLLLLLLLTRGTLVSPL